MPVREHVTLEWASSLDGYHYAAPDTSVYFDYQTILLRPGVRWTLPRDWSLRAGPRFEWLRAPRVPTERYLEQAIVLEVERLHGRDWWSFQPIVGQRRYKRSTSSVSLDDPDLQPESYRRHVDRMGRELLTEIPAGADDAAKLRALRHYFFEEQGFHGSRGEFHDRANSYLNNVIEHREGIPITLSLLFIEVGQRVGLAQLRAHPLPGHFMAAIKLADGTDHVIDVFEGGRELTHEEADLVVRQFSEGDVKSELLEPARKRDIIVRMVRNLATISRADGADNSTLRYLDLILALQPSAHIDRLERAKVRARSNDIPGAKEDLQWLLDHAPPGIVPDRIEELLKSL